MTFNDITDEREFVNVVTMHEAYELIIFKGWKNKSDYMAKHFDKFIEERMLLVWENFD